MFSYQQDNNYLFQWSQKFRVAVVSMSSEDMEFDMIGVDPAIANALRRLLIAEVPTMAIEKVYIINNTSVIQDNVSQDGGKLRSKFVCVCVCVCTVCVGGEGEATISWAWSNFLFFVEVGPLSLEDFESTYLERSSLSQQW